MKIKNKLQTFLHYPLILLTSLQLSCGSSKYSEKYQKIFDPSITHNFKAVYLKEINVGKKSDLDFTFTTKFNYDLYEITYKPYREYNTDTEVYSGTRYALVDFRLLKKRNKLDESGKTAELRPFYLTYEDGSRSFRTYAINLDGSLSFELKSPSEYETLKSLRLERYKGYRYGVMDTTTIIPNDSYVIKPDSYNEKNRDKGKPALVSEGDVVLLLSLYEPNRFFLDLDHGGDYKSPTYKRYMSILANYFGTKIYAQTKRSAKKIAINHKFEDDERKKKIKEDNKKIEVAGIEAQKIKEAQRLEDIVNQINSNFGNLRVTLLDATDGTEIQGAKIEVSSYAQSPDDLSGNYGVSLSSLNGFRIVSNYPYGKNDENDGNKEVCFTSGWGNCDFKVFKNAGHFITITKSGYQQLIRDKKFKPEKNSSELKIRLPKSGIPLDVSFDLKNLFGGSGLEIEEK